MPAVSAAKPKVADKTRSQRLNIRVTAAQARLIRLAAEQTRATTSAFLVESACIRAEEALASKTHFLYNEEQWAAFTAALDRPPALKPRLRRLLTTPGILDRA